MIQSLRLKKSGYRKAKRSKIQARHEHYEKIRLERLLENKFNFTSIGLKTNVILIFFYYEYFSTPLVFLAELNFRAAV
jgi:hypothetical protein